jgi:hypothetical protein
MLYGTLPLAELWLAVAEASAGVFVSRAHFSQIRDAQRVLVAQTSARLPDGQVCALFFNSSANQNHTG